MGQRSRPLQRTARASNGTHPLRPDASRVAFQPMRMRRSEMPCPWRKEDDGRPELNSRDSARPEGRTFGQCAPGGNNHEVGSTHSRPPTAPVRQRPPFRPRYSVTSHNVFEIPPGGALRCSQVVSSALQHFSNARTARKGLRGVTAGQAA